MARVAINIRTLKGSANPANAGTIGTGGTLRVSADVVNGNYWTMRPGDILMVRNEDGATPRTVTISGPADPQGRTQNAVVAITNGNETPFGPFEYAGWSQSGANAGQVFVDGDNANLKLVVLRQP